MTGDEGRGRRILVVEDEVLIAGLLVDVLRGAGHEVDAVTSGAEALRRLAAGPYNLIVSDLMMPGLDGPGLYQAIEERHPQMCARMVFVTGSASQPAYARFLRRTGAPWIAKPFTLAALMDFVDQAFRRLER